MPNKHFMTLNVSSGLIVVKFIAAYLLLELIISEKQFRSDFQSRLKMEILLQWPLRRLFSVLP